MTRPDTARNFLLGEVQSLEPFEFVVFGPSGEPLQAVEVTRGEDGALEVRIPGRAPVFPELPVPVRAALRDRGFASADASDKTKPWSHTASDAEAAVDSARAVLVEVFGAKPDATLDVAHGSHRAEYEAERRLAAVRERIEPVLQAKLGRAPERDADDDYVLPVADVHVMVAPRAIPGGPVVVRVFAICNVGVTVAPELGLFLARLNFGLMFGRFALDTENRAIWFDEMLLGDHFTDEELRFAIDVVATTADSWDDRLKQMFGGQTYQEVLKGRKDGPRPGIKPGQAGYL